MSEDHSKQSRGDARHDRAITALAPEAFARALFEQSPFSCVIYDTEGKPVAVNAAFTRLLGLTLDDRPADYTIFTDPQLASVMPQIRRAFAGERVTLPPVRWDSSVYVPDGRVTWTQPEFYPIRNDAGELVHVVLVHLDLTPRVEAEDALRTSERELAGARLRLEAILNAVSDGITVQDESGAVIYANDAAARLIGFANANELLDTPLAELRTRFELRDESGRNVSYEQLPGPRALQGEDTPEALLNYRIRSTGEERWSLVRSRSIRDEQGRPFLVVNAFSDVTERVHQQRTLEETAQRLEELAAEQELTMEELRLRSEEAEEARRDAEWAGERARYLAEAGKVLASSLDYEKTLRAIARLAVPRIADWCTVHIVDESGDVRRLEVAHADPKRLEMARVYEQQYPPDPETSGVHRVVRTGNAELYADIPDEMLAHVARDDEQLRMLRELGLRSAMIVPLIAHERILGGITLIAAESERHYEASDLAFAEDLASRAALAVHTAMLYHEAHEANLAKSKFLAVMSHELRTPLNAILGYADLLALEIGGALSPQQQEQLSRISQSAQHLTQLVETVLSFARVDAGKEHVIEGDVDLVEAARESLALVEPLAAKKELKLELIGAAPVTVHSDVAKIRQILLNLLSNAVKFTDEGGVRVQVYDEDGAAVISVRDTGIGISQADQLRIWEPFSQLDPALTRRSGGTGLGLPVSLNLARLLGGSLDVVSAPGKGSTFTLRLPKRRRPE